MLTAQKAAAESPAAETALIDETLAAPSRRLAFPPALERRFEADTGRQRCRHLMVRLALAIVVFNLFALNDAVMLTDVLPRSLFLRLVVATGLGLAVIALLARNPPPLLREGAATLFILVGVTILVHLMLVSTAPYREHLAYGLLLVVMFAANVLRLRFWYSLIACGACFVLHQYAIAHLAGVPWQVAANSAGLVACAILFSLAGGYTLEREERVIYLQSLRLRLQADALDALSLVDPLTGLGNRRALDRRLGEIEGTERGVLSILLIDIDFFKAFNDRHGHIAGDRCLQRVTAILAAELRGTEDGMVRYGGEEFLVLLPGADREAAIAIAERMRAAIASAAIPHGAETAGGVVTASFGVATRPAGSPLPAETLIAEADAALYRAKHAGRNRVVAAA